MMIWDYFESKMFNSLQVYKSYDSNTYVENVIERNRVDFAPI